MRAQLNYLLPRLRGWGEAPRPRDQRTRPQAGGEPETTAARAGLLLRGDRNIASFASIFVLGGLETDHVKSVELRGLVELGTGIKFYELKEGELERSENDG